MREGGWGPPEKGEDEGRPRGGDPSPAAPSDHSWKFKKCAREQRRRRLWATGASSDSCLFPTPGRQDVLSAGILGPHCRVDGDPPPQPSATRLPSPTVLPDPPQASSTELGVCPPPIPGGHI